MSQRQLFIAAYDIREPRRLRRCLHILKDYACGGQKSVFECYLSSAERQELLERMAGTMDLGEDRFLIAPLPAEASVYTLGIAVPPSDPEFYYVG
ncbi:CRISPR-associated endonuclease Cas2 [Azotobacter salinestris]|uniref:CRISPR-associated endonuclease Cas2 n=1 Tax=Azotobacter salinestris TaxID=69964 RepID=UPI0032DF978F